MTLTYKYYIMKPILIFCTLILASISLKAQESDPLDKIKAQKVAFLTERLGLNPATAQKFWPVYNEFSSKKDSVNNLRSSQRKEMKDRWDKMSNRQKEAALDFQMQQRFEEAKLEQHYHDKFKKILTIDQVLRLYEAEHEFKMRLIRQLRQKETSQGNIDSQKIISQGFQQCETKPNGLQTIN